MPAGLDTPSGSPGFRPLIFDQSERLHVSIHALIFYINFQKEAVHLYTYLEVFATKILLLVEY